MIVAFMAMLCYSTFNLAQSTTIQLLDKANNEPIVGVTFQYDKQVGIADENGNINLEYIADAILKLSHLNYGNWELSDEAVQKAIELGKILRASQSVSLYPVTVIALRTKSDEVQTLDFDYQDNLAHDGGALLRKIPAISTIQKGGNYGFDPVLRGFKYDQLNIVLNGVQSATAACPNRMDPPTSQMAPNMIDRVEVLKGPHALRYGNGLGGTINFIPTPLRFAEKIQSYGRFSGAYNSNGAVLRSEGLVGFSGKRYDVGLFGGWSQGNDYTDGGSETVQADFLRGSFGANLGFKINNQQELRLSATRNLARDTDFPALAMDLRTDNTWLFNAQHTVNFSKQSLTSWTTTAFGSIVNHVMDNLLKPLDPRMVNATTNAQTFNYGGRTEGVWQWKNNRLYGGLDMRVESATGNRSREFLMGLMAGNTVTDNAWQSGFVNRMATFGEYHFHQKNIHWVFSGRLEVNNANIQDENDEFTNVYEETKSLQINPSISIGGLKNFENNLAVGVWLGRAQRSGSLSECFINYFPIGQDPYEMLGNPQLQPEVNHQVDVTFEWKNQQTHFNLDIFAAYLTNYISSVIDTSLAPRLPTSPGVRQFTNIEKAFKTGFEISWQQKLGANLQHLLGAAFTYGQDLERVEPLPEIAPVDIRYTIWGKYLKEKLTPELTFRYVLGQNRISQEFGETTTPAFALIDINIGYEILSNLNMTMGVQNLLNTHYYEHLNRSVRGSDGVPIYALGRNFFVAFSMDW